MGTNEVLTSNMPRAAAARFSIDATFCATRASPWRACSSRSARMPSGAAAAPLEFITALGGGREDKSYPVPAKDGTQIDKDNQTIVTRWQNKVYVFSLACPHQNTAIRWYEKEHQFECPKHHSRFEVGRRST